MRVLRVITSMDPKNGGPCQGIRNSIPALKKLGVHTEVACMDVPGVEYIKGDDFPIHLLGPSKTSWCYAPGLIPWLTDNVAKYDAVVVHGLWQYHSYAVRKVMNKLRKNKVKNLPAFYMMPHGMLDPYFQKAEGRKIKALRNWFYWKLIESQNVHSSNGVLFTCEEELRLARQTFQPYHPKQELNVGYGIENPFPYTLVMKQAFEQKCPQLNGKKCMLFLSRIHVKKGVDMLINAYEQILRSYPDYPMLVIAGPGMDEPYGQGLKQTVENSELLRKKVLFPGMLTGPSKWGAFYGSEVFVLPSHQENFGISVAEALACSKPVLISDQVNIWREIEEGGAGYVAKDTSEGTYQLLKFWAKLAEPQKKEMSAKAWQTFEKEFDIEPAAAKFLKAISNSN